jgi:hypothetical protein
VPRDEKNKNQDSNVFPPLGEIGWFHGGGKSRKRDMWRLITVRRNDGPSVLRVPDVFKDWSITDDYLVWCTDWLIYNSCKKVDYQPLPASISFSSETSLETAHTTVNELTDRPWIFVSRT